MGIEPTQPAWEAGILPLNYACKFGGNCVTRTHDPLVNSQLLYPTELSSQTQTRQVARSVVGLVLAESIGFEPI